jgi:hypothetical protein
VVGMCQMVSVDKRERDVPGELRVCLLSLES